MSSRIIPLPAVIASLGQSHGSIRYTPGKLRPSTPPTPISERSSEEAAAGTDLRHDDLFEATYNRHPGIDFSPNQSSITSLIPEANTTQVSVESSGYSDDNRPAGCGCWTIMRFLFRSLCATPD